VTGSPSPSAVDLALDPLPGRSLHDVLEAARRDGPVSEAVFLGAPAVIVTGFEDLRGFFTAEDQFPGGAAYRIHTEPAVGRTFISMDGAEHTTYRRLTTPAFRSRATARFVDEALVPLVHEIVDGFAADGRADLVARVARVLPFWAISRKLGLPLGTEDRQRRWALALLSYPRDPEGAGRASREVTAFLEPIVESLRHDPGDDVISHLLSAEHDGTRLTDDEVFSHIRLLYAVGATTTSDAMSSLFRVVLSDPDLLDRAREEPAVRPRIVEEVLRYEPPVAILPRLAPVEGEISGVRVAPGTVVLGAIAAANRDPDVFAEPDAFDPDRHEPDILTFGFGPKFCPGSHLARRQLLAALEVVVERLRGLRLVSTTEPAGAVLRSVESVIAEWEPT